MFICSKSSLPIAALAPLLVVCQPLQVAHAIPLPASSQQSQATEANLALTLSAVQDVVEGGSPVKVAFAARNITDQMVQYSCWILIPCGLEVRDANGNEPPDTKLHRRFRVSKSPNVSVEEIPMGIPGLGVLKPGEVKTYVIDVDGWYDFSQPGMYTIQVVRTTEKGETWLKSNSITVEVGPSAATQPRPSTTETPASQPPFSLTIKMDSNPGYPVGLTIKTINTSGHRILLRTEKASKEHAGSIYKIDLSDSTGTSPPETEYGRLTRNREHTALFPLASSTPRGGGVSLSLKPGEGWADSIMLNTVYTLNQSGLYTIQVRRWDDETQTWVKSNIITVTIDQYGRVRSTALP
jgi:hypothetical protein